MCARDAPCPPSPSLTLPWICGWVAAGRSAFCSRRILEKQIRNFFAQATEFKRACVSDMFTRAVSPRAWAWPTLKHVFIGTRAWPYSSPTDQSAYFGVGYQKLSGCSSWMRPCCRRISIALLLLFLHSRLFVSFRSHAVHRHVPAAPDAAPRESVKQCCTPQAASVSLSMCLKAFCYYVSSVPESTSFQNGTCLSHHYQYARRVDLVWILFLRSGGQARWRGADCRCLRCEQLEVLLNIRWMMLSEAD